MPAGAMHAEFERIFASASRDDWEQRFAGTDACVSAVLSIAEATRHPVNAERSVFIDHNGVMQAAPAPRFSATPGQVTPNRSATVEDIVGAWSKAG